MQHYTASNPITGNSSYSFIDQETADKNLKFLDDNNCKDCKDCKDCNNCNNCKDCNSCYNCYNCYSCNNCNNCNNCYNCKDCTACKNCYNCKNCTACYDCNNCKNCIACYDCYDCNSCNNVQSTQDYLILGPAQSSNRMTYAYIDSKLKSLVISCGCFNGSLDEFKSIIFKTHKDSPIYLAQYNAFAACIESSLSHRIPK